MASKLIELKRFGRKECCILCHGNKVDELTYGTIYKFGKVVVHYFCLLLSTNVAQLGEDEEGILGFLPNDILKAAEESSSVDCTICYCKGANIRCATPRCLAVFHYPCGIEKKSSHQFYGKFASFCPKHRIQQKIPNKVLYETEGMQLECIVCFETVQIDNNIIWAPCCQKNAFFHRRCLQRMAYSFGSYTLKCPLCNDKRKFTQALKQNGIFIPQQDASWETQPHAFSELLERYSQCDAVKCLCPEGRNYSQDSESNWEITLCSDCGSHGIHKKCNKDKTAIRWRCDVCKSTESARETHQQRLPRSSPSISSRTENCNNSDAESYESENAKADSDVDVGVGTHNSSEMASNSAGTATVDNSSNRRYKRISNKISLENIIVRRRRARSSYKPSESENVKGDVSAETHTSTETESNCAETKAINTSNDNNQCNRISKEVCSENINVGRKRFRSSYKSRELASVKGDASVETHNSAETASNCAETTPINYNNHLYNDILKEISSENITSRRKRDVETHNSSETAYNSAETTPINYNNHQCNEILKEISSENITSRRKRDVETHNSSETAYNSAETTPINHNNHRCNKISKEISSENITDSWKRARSSCKSDVHEERIHIQNVFVCNSGERIIFLPELQNQEPSLVKRSKRIESNTLIKASTSTTRSSSPEDPIITELKQTKAFDLSPIIIIDSDDDKEKNDNVITIDSDSDDDDDDVLEVPGRLKSEIEISVVAKNNGGEIGKVPPMPNQEFSIYQSNFNFAQQAPRDESDRFMIGRIGHSELRLVLSPSKTTTLNHNHQ